MDFVFEAVLLVDGCRFCDGYFGVSTTYLFYLMACLSRQTMVHNTQLLDVGFDGVSIPVTWRTWSTVSH